METGTVSRSKGDEVAGTTDSIIRVRGATRIYRQGNLVMHVGLELPDGQMIMASDMLEGMGPMRVEGNNISISLHPDSKREADRIFDALAEGGTITMPIADQFWGDYFGSLIDRFGINWMVNYSEVA